MKSGFDRNWFLPIQELKEADYNLVCFPCGGGSSASFWAWKSFSLKANIWSLKLPGRDSRFEEKHITQSLDLIPKILEALPENPDLPLVFYGHSLGAGLAFQSVLALEDLGRKLPLSLIVAGREPPHYPPLNPIKHFDDKALLNYLENLGGIQKTIPRDVNFLKHYLPKIRADYELNASIPDQIPVSFPISISVLNGQADALIDLLRMKEWSRYAQYDFSESIFPGGHFFMEENVLAFKRFIKAKLELTRG